MPNGVHRFNEPAFKCNGICRISECHRHGGLAVSSQWRYCNCDRWRTVRNLPLDCYIASLVALLSALFRTDLYEPCDDVHLYVNNSKWGSTHLPLAILDHTVTNILAADMVLVAGGQYVCLCVCLFV